MHTLVSQDVHGCAPVLCCRGTYTFYCTSTLLLFCDKPHKFPLSDFNLLTSVKGVNHGD